MKLVDLLRDPNYWGAVRDFCLGDEGTLRVDLVYPRTEKAEVRRVIVGLCDTRAADSLLIEYDFDRDGYVIQQASRFSWAEDEEPDPDWQEVAFIPAWQREADGED